MKSTKLLLLVFAFMLFSTCKKESDNNSETTTAKLVTALNLHDGAGVKYKEVHEATGDSLEAFIEMANWCLVQPEVETVYLIDDNIVKVHFKNGLITPIFVIPVSATGEHLIRGGGSAALKRFGDEDDHIIENKKVMIFLPFEHEFYKNGYPFLPKFSEGKQKLEYNLLIDEAADLAAISTFADYGLIILDTHGETNGFCIRTKILEFDEPIVPGRTPLTEEQLKTMMERANNLPLDKIESGELQLDYLIHVDESINAIACSNGVLVTDRYIRNLPHLDNAVVFGNHCFSGYTYLGPGAKNLPEAWKSIGAVTYYGYAYADGKSRKAENYFCVQMEDSIITNLLNDLDSTGIAHLANNTDYQSIPEGFSRTGGVEVPPPPPRPDGSFVVYSRVKYNEDYPPIPRDFYFEQFHDKRYKYKPCGDTLLDMRDMEVYETVCIGDQVWMAENLRYNAPGSAIASNNPSLLATYGRYYTYLTISAGEGMDPGNQPSTIHGICPDGWHIPNAYEWEQLKAAIGFPNNNELAVRLKSPDDWSGDSDINHPFRNVTGFSALPSELAEITLSNGNVNYFPSDSEFFMWLSSPFTSCITGWTGVLYMSSSSFPVSEGCVPADPGGGGFGQAEMYSCRCVKD